MFLPILYRQVYRRSSRDIKLRLAQMFPKMRTALEIHMQTGMIDWSRSKAYANGKRSEIWINLKGRQPQGIVEPGREYDELCFDIDNQLRAARDPVTGEPYVERVFRREEVYKGPFVYLAPDLLVRWHRGGWIDNIAPTIFYLMGLPVPSDMDGRVLTEIIEPYILSSRPVRKAEVKTDATDERHIFNQEDEEIIAERLRGLGYVD
jgi:hypothetical protein